MRIKAGNEMTLALWLKGEVTDEVSFRGYELE